jgi:hypothetical protein
MTGLLDDSEKKAIDKDFSTLRLIWMALMAAVVAYVATGIAFDRFVGPVDAGMADLPGYARTLVQYGGYVLAAAVLALGCWVGRSVPRSDSLGTFKTKMLISFGLCEAAALLGFITLVFNGDRSKLYILAGFALAAMVYVMPRRGEFIAVAESAKQYD